MDPTNPEEGKRKETDKPTQPSQATAPPEEAESLPLDTDNWKYQASSRTASTLKPITELATLSSLTDSSELNAQMQSGYGDDTELYETDILSSDYQEKQEDAQDTEKADASKVADEYEGPTDERDAALTRLIQGDFFYDFQLTPMPEMHFNLNPDADNPQFQNLKNEMGFKHNDVDMTRLLAADHPLLNRFQKSLKEQLVKKVYSMREEVADLIESCKTRKEEKEVLGIEAYETQQTSLKQEKAIRNCLKDIETVTGAREELDCQLAKAEEEWTYEKDENFALESEEISIRAEMESVDILMQEMKNWEAEVEGELMVHQRIMDNTAKEKLDLYKEQKQLDAVIFNLMKEVWKLEGEIEHVQMQIRIKDEDRERLAEAVTLANIDIESNQTEHRCLLHGWQSVLVTINQRDKYFNSLQADFTKLDDLQSGVTSELIHIKKEIQREHMENERLTLIKDRLEYEMGNVSKALDAETEKHAEYLKIVAKYDKIIEENNKQREKMRMEITAVKEEEAALSQEIENLNRAKYQLEQDILIHLQSSAFNNDACRQMANVLKDCKEENRRMRINIARVEGQISHTHAEYQSLRLENGEVAKQLREIKMITAEEDKDLINIGKDFDKTEKLLSKNILLYEQLKLKASNDASPEKIEMFPEEVRIRLLEAANAELIEKNKQSQSFWLREQAIVVELSEKRQAQMKDMDLLKKQICVMDQKNLRINDTLERLSNMEDKLSKSINNFENKMNVYTTGLHKKQNNKAALNASNQKIKSELQNKLEDSEFESLRLKAEIVEIEEEKYALSRELIEKNREALCWEKKLLMVLDTRKQMCGTQGESSELSQMRTEIHRMNVRYSQLRKAQDKLIHDLDNCIFRRGSIVTLAEARTRGHKGGTQQWRVNFNKRRNDLKNKLIEVDQEGDRMIEKTRLRAAGIEQLNEEIRVFRMELDALVQQRGQKLERVELAKVNRQLRLDVLLYKQKKLKMYVELSRGRCPYVCYKTQTMAHNAYTKGRHLNTKLRNIVEDLQLDLPQHIHFLTKCHNSLVLPAVKL